MHGLKTSSDERIQKSKPSAAVPERAGTSDRRALWVQADPEITGADAEVAVITKALQGSFTGVALPLSRVNRYAPLLSPRLAAVLLVNDDDGADWDGAIASLDGRVADVVIASASSAVLAEARRRGLSTCLRCHVDDATSLHRAITEGQANDYVAIRFKDPTNIPLELVIASLQASSTVLIKEIEPGDREDALVVLGVMEVGADGILYRPHSVTDVVELEAKLSNQAETLAIVPATIITTRAVGMGFRSCIDLATIFAPTEGILIGSTSHGGFLACPEVFPMPYMELRPFRVNAGAVHSYLYNAANKTSYLTELKAGTPVQVVGLDGRTRTVPVGRIKTEVRPLRMIEAALPGGSTINLLMQDDWHVRIYGIDGSPINITELRPGDVVAAFGATAGRHVGIAIKENILES
jgi:3-amino-4-hydroxybenzoic acid synthase